MSLFSFILNLNNGKIVSVMNKIPLKFKKYFWDTDFAKIDPKKHQTYIIERLLEYGDSQAYRFLTKNFPKSELKKIAAKSRQLSPKTKNFWQTI